MITAIVLASTTAAAEPLDLRLPAERTPRQLRMRVAQPEPEEPEPKEPEDTTPESRSMSARAQRATGDIARLVRRAADVVPDVPTADKLVLRVDLGIAVDGLREVPVERDGMGGITEEDEIPDYASVRSYSLGTLYAGTRGLGVKSVSTYTATQLRVAPKTNETLPIANPYDTVTDVQSRTAWIEANDMFRQKWLRPIRARAGRMYAYGPTIVHYDGLVLAYEMPWLELASYGGRRVPAFLPEEEDADAVAANRGDALSGAQLRVDLHRFELPVVIALSSLVFKGHAHSEASGTLEPRRDVLIRSSSRFQDGRLARQRLVVRARVSEDSTIAVDNQLRTRADWFWDYASLTPVIGDDPSSSIGGDVDVSARRYLDLGPRRPRFQSALLAGTVIAQNLDLLARGAVALDLLKREDDALNPHLPEYVEGGAGVEVRLRRALAIQSSALIRDYNRPPAHAIDTPATPDELPATKELGEEWLIEGGAALRYTAGARRFSALIELYGRRTRWVPLYEDTTGERAEVVTFHGGGRMFADAWINPRIRARVEYDLSTFLEEAPAFRGLKQLRLWLEGTY